MLAQNYLHNLLAAIFLIAAAEKASTFGKFLGSLHFFRNKALINAAGAAIILVEVSFFFIIGVIQLYAELFMGGFLGMLVIYQVAARDDQPCACFGSLDDDSTGLRGPLRIGLMAGIFGLGYLLPSIQAELLVVKLLALANAIVLMVAGYQRKIANLKF